MSRIDSYLCDNPHCKKETSDPVGDFWIHFDCHGDDGCTLKKGAGVLLTDLQNRDFCSMDCLLEVLDQSKITITKTPDKIAARVISKRPLTVPKLGKGSRKVFEWIRSVPTLQECLKGFRERYSYGKWRVSDDDLQRIWEYYHPVQDPISTGNAPDTVAIEEGDSYSPQELEILLHAQSHSEAWDAYKAAYPGSTRKYSSIRTLRNRHWSQSEGEKRRKELIAKEKNGSAIQPQDTEPVDQDRVQDPDPPGDEDAPKNNGFFVGAKVVQVKGTQRAFGVGDVTQVRPNGDLVVQFFNNRKVLPVDHFALYQGKNQDGKQESAAAVEGS